MKPYPSGGSIFAPAALVVFVSSLTASADQPASQRPVVDAQAPPGAVCESSDEGHEAAVPAKQPTPRIHGIFRHTSYPAAWTAAQKTKRPILVYVTSSSCPHCVQMIEQTYKRPAIKQVMHQQFETVYVDRGRQPKLVQQLRVRWFPTTIVVAADNKVLDKIEGYVAASAFAERLETQLAIHNAIANDAEKSLVQK